MLHSSTTNPPIIGTLLICTICTLLSIGASNDGTLAGELVASRVLTQSDLDANTSSSQRERPNILFLMGDDWSWPHATALGDPVVKTPTFDRLAHEGVLFEHAFVSAPSCTPSRMSIATGQWHWRLGGAANLGGSLAKDVPVYPELLESTGYQIGFARKGAAPSKHEHRGRDPFGPRFKSFDEFQKVREPGKPFCFWYGAGEPHRPYIYETGVRSGLSKKRVVVPACLPDHDVVRTDLCDYYEKIQQFDKAAGHIISLLETSNQLDNTMVVMTGDNGLPFPRCKATLYDTGTRVPLAIRWGREVKGGRTVADFVTLCDLAPTFLKAAGLPIAPAMTGRSLLSILASEESGQVDPTRNHVLTGMERHVFANPSRALRTADYLYVLNYDPQMWRTGRGEGPYPEYDFSRKHWPSSADAFSFNVDPSPTKQLMLGLQSDSAFDGLKDLAFGQRPVEELYDLKSDPEQLKNVADQPAFRRARKSLRRQLESRLLNSQDPRLVPEGYESRTIKGWTVLVSEKLMTDHRDKTMRALELLEDQIELVLEAVPAKAVEHLRGVTIWLSPVYPGRGPTGEYHPDEGWLRRNGRNPLLQKCIEFTNVLIFEREIKRMPVLLMHELAHAYHDQVFGFDDPGITATWKAAVDNGSYDSVPRGNGKKERAYAMTNQMEYFAETSEAFFGVNDFFPFNATQLAKHDPAMYRLLALVWDVDPLADSATDSSQNNYTITPPPEELKLDTFYSKYVEARGYPVVSSERVNDYALKEAAYLIDMMLAKRSDVCRAMIASGSRMIVMAHNEFTTDIPEYSKMRPKDFWDARARGLGGSRRDAVCSSAEENLLGFEGDPYSTENILIHEFAHNIHLRGMVHVDPTFDDRLKRAYDKAMSAGLWKGKYASTNHAEYFAEGVQSWFNNNRPPDHDHNHVDTREELREYDADLAAMCEEVFGDTELVYTKPTTRLEGHLAGYDPSNAPKFEWPERLEEAKRKIRKDAEKRGENRKKRYTK